MKYDVLLVAAAMEELSKESEVGSQDNAQIIIHAFHSLESMGLVAMEITTVKKSGSVKGQTDLGEMDFKNNDETVTDVRGIKYARVGKWKVWREVLPNNFSRIWFVHFLSQGIHDGVRDREFFVEYSQSLTPTGFGYLGEFKQFLKFLFFRLHKREIVIVFGEVRGIKTRILMTIESS